MTESLLAAVGVPGLLLGFGVLALAVWRLRPSGERTWIVGAVAAIAFGALLYMGYLGSPERLGPAWLERARSSYEEIWASLDAASLEGAAALETVDLTEHGRLDLFRRLERLAERLGVTMLLLDPEGSAFVWAGEGLLHALEGKPIPSTGPVFASSFSAVTLGSVRRVGLQPGAWRLLAGRSFSSQRLPFAAPAAEQRSDFLWAVAAQGSRLPERSIAVAPEGRPSMALLPAPGAPFPGESRRTTLLAASWLALAIALLLVAGAAGGRAEVFSRPSAGATLASGLLAVGVAAGLDGLGIGLAAGSLGVLWGVWYSTVDGSGGRTPLGPGVPSPIPSRTLDRWWARLAPAMAVAVVALLAFRLEKVIGPQGLATGLLVDVHASTLRLVAFLVVLAGLVPSAHARFASRSDTRRSSRGTGPMLVCFAGLVAGALTMDHLATAATAVLVAALGAARWIESRSGSSSSRLLDGLLVIGLAALLVATTWQIMHRYLQERYLERDIAPRLGPPTTDEKEALTRQIEAYFDGLDLAELAPVEAWELDTVDLAYALWAGSPLAEEGKLSSLTVLVDEVSLSSFEFGVPTTPSGRVDRSPIAWQGLAIPGWDEALFGGEVSLTHFGTAEGTIRWAVLPRPGFRLVDGPAEQLAATLVRGTLSRQLPIEPLIDPARFAVYADRPRPSLGGADLPTLDAATLAESHFEIARDGRSFEGWSRSTAGVHEVLLLPGSRPLRAFDGIGIQAVGTLLALLAILLLVALTVPLDAGWLRAQWNQVYRSYSKKMVLIYGTMLLVPLLAVTLALLGVVGERLERTREAAGEAAMDAAQHVLGEYVLSLDPGFGVDTALDNSLLDWLARVIHHEVNLYWGSELYASSNPELFTAGFLPERIPGEIYAELTLEASSLARRVNRASGERYLELYAPLRIPGVRAQELLFLSIPLLAQQEEVEAEIASLRARAVLAAVILLVAVLVTARRLSRGFTKPLTDLISGTESIAAGARSLDLEPSELELAALVNAINRMAERVAEARDRLTVEKQVVEKVVENITAGVVSLDDERRVLLANGVAKSLLSIEVGDRLEDALADSPQRRELAAVASSPSSEPVQRTLTIPKEEGEPREWTVIWVPIPGEGEPSSLLVVEDVTEVLRGQRLQAWAEMARIIAHEIKNPLTPIRLSTQHMLEMHARDTGEFDAVFERCSQNILRQVEELQTIASEFSTYSRIPQIRPRPDDLVQAVEEIVDSYRVAPPEGMEIALSTEPESVPYEFDRRLLGRALRNLIENALRASRGANRGTDRRPDDEPGRVEVEVVGDPHEIAIHVQDRGPGADSETLAQMFDPYFSTDSSGTGLGLPIARRIVEEHGGTLTAANRPGGGLRVTVRLPRMGDAEPGGDLN